MEAGGSGESLSVAEGSHLYRFVQVLSAGQTGLEVEETEEQHTEAEGAEGIAGRSHFQIGPARKNGEKCCGRSRRLLEFWPFSPEDSGLGDCPGGVLSEICGETASLSRSQ